MRDQILEPAKIDNYLLATLNLLKLPADNHVGMKSTELQARWWDWLSASELLLRSLHEQTAAVTLRDVQRVQRIQPELNALIQQLRTSDEEAVACAERLAKELEVPANLRSVVQALEKMEGQQLHGLANRVQVASRNVQEVLRKNRRLLEREMIFINGTLTLVARAAVEVRTPYRKRILDPVLADRAA